MKKHCPTSTQLVFPPVHLNVDRREPTWSVNVELPLDVETELAAYENPAEGAVWTVLIHEALYVYRWQFWSQEALDAEVMEAMEEGLRDAEAGNTTAVTPELFESFEQACRRDVKHIHELQAKGELGNLLLPKELYAFILERIESGDCLTPTDVVCRAMPAFRRERLNDKKT
jgi:hypothetical protein